MTIYDKYTPDQIQRGLSRLTADLALLDTAAEPEEAPRSIDQIKRMTGAAGKLKHAADNHRAVLITPAEAAALIDLLETSATGNFVLAHAADPYEEEAAAPANAEPARKPGLGMFRSEEELDGTAIRPKGKRP